MSKKVVYPVILISILISLSFVSAFSFSDFFKFTGNPTYPPGTQICMDTDSGSYPNTFGYVTFVYGDGSIANGTWAANGSLFYYNYSDYCATNSTVSERSCVNNSMDTHILNCDFDRYCLNGECVINTSYIPPNQTNQTSSNVTCTDTDGGQNITYKGSAQSVNSTGYYEIVDYCSSTTMIYESVCSSSTNQSSYVLLNCGSEMTCYDGSCRNQSSGGGSTNNSSGSGSNSSSGGGGAGGGSSGGTPRSGEGSGAGSVAVGGGSGSGFIFGKEIPPSVVKNSQGNTFSIDKGASKIKTPQGTEAKIVVVIETDEKAGKAYAVKTSGEKEEIVISPDNARVAFQETVDTDTFGEIVMKEDNGKVVYNVEATKDVKVLWFIKAKMNINADVDVTSGEVVKVSKPWWALFAK
ncbi:PepSY domain-containing protein [Candidatus Pacearchaeota archaeon]|nr:PepSY domain-containing protein [Candidatus Pacearchaeota archaeon]